MMKICLFVEGSYPYIIGGVSSWVHSIINSFPHIEFSLVALLPDRSYRGKFQYKLPENLASIREVYLQDFDWNHNSRKNRINRITISQEEYDALRGLIIGKDIKWGKVFDYFRQDISINNLLMSPEFLDIVKEYCNSKQMNVTFSDFLWTLRSICLPLFMALQCQPPKAHLYHCISTGYAGIIGSMAKHLNPGASMLVSEHGIYTREREEEIIKAKWVKGIYKNIWIEQFYKMSQCAYKYADQVTSLFIRAKELQIELGCPEDKIRIIPNGVDTRAFQNLPQKKAHDTYINIGAFLRIAPIKDVKTMINAFYYAQKEMSNLKLWLMGPDDEDPQYARECRDLVSNLGVENVVFTGRIKTRDYMGRMDITILTSISEGQPLTILESFAAQKPCIATNVGNCLGLINGEADDYGKAGLVVPVLNIKEITNAILKLAKDERLRNDMGKIGYKRVMDKYRWESFINNYGGLYENLYNRFQERPELSRDSLKEAW